MRRVLKCLGLIILGGGLVWSGHWLQEYLYPDVISPSEVHVAWLLGGFAYQVVSDLAEKHGSEGATDRGLRTVTVCVDRNHEGPLPSMEFLRDISYFRSLAKPWDPRGALLDRSWAKATARRYANGVFFDVQMLKASLDYWESLSAETERLQYLFLEDCRTVAGTKSWPLVKLVALSPAIKNPYCVHDEVASCYGFFAAMEAVYADGQTKREIKYYARDVLSRRPTLIFDGIPPPTEKIPEEFWRHEFGAWKSIPAVASEIPSLSKGKGWYDNVFPSWVIW